MVLVGGGVRWQSMFHCSLSVFIFMSLVAIAGTDLVVTLRPPQLTVMEGERAVFSCSPLFPTALPILEQDGFIVTRREHPRVSFIDLEATSGKSNEGNRTYTLRDVTLDDDGTTFRCIIGSFLSNILTLNVVVSPVVTGFSGALLVLEHSTETTTLDYSVFAVPPPTSFAWLRNGADFSGNERVAVRRRNQTRLVVRGARREDAGNYTFIARSSVGVGSLSLLLRVEYDEFLQTPQDLMVMAGAMITMNCQHRFGLVYAWRSTTGVISQHDTKVEIGVTGRTLRYGPVDHSDHLLELYCIVHSEMGQLYTSPLGILTVKTPPLILAPESLTVTEGTDIQLHFNIRGYPPPISLNYYYNDQELPLPSSDGRIIAVNDDSGVLIIERVTRHDAGNYTLEVENLLGEVCASIQLTVLFAPVISPLISVPVVTQFNSSVTIRCGEDVVANPPPTFSWMYDSGSSKPRRLQTSDPRISVDMESGVLIIDNTQYSDTGMYTCVARNTIGSSSISITVLVRDPPSPPLDVFAIEVGSTWAFIVWSRPTDNGSFPLSMYLLSASPQPMNYLTNASTELALLTDVTNINLDEYGDLDRGFPTNTACIEHMCEVTHKSVGVKTGAQQAANVTGLIPAVNYSLVVFSFTNGSNLQSDPSQLVYFVTDKYVPGVGSVFVTVYEPGVMLVNWTLAFSGGCPVLYFELSFKKVDSEEWTVSGVDSNTTIPPDFRSWMIRGLESDTLYTVRILAVNMVGKGEYTTLPEPVLSHPIGAPGPPTQPIIVGWDSDYAIVNTSLAKLGSSEETFVTVVLLKNGTEITSMQAMLPREYVANTSVQVTFGNTSYRGEFQFSAFASNTFGDSDSSVTSEFAFQNIEEVTAPQSIAGPTLGCAVGAINIAVVFISIGLCSVMAKESSKQRKSLARRIEMVQAADCPVSPRSLLFIDSRSSPDGRSRTTPTVESLYAECLRRTEPSAPNHNNKSTITNLAIVSSQDVVTSQPTSTTRPTRISQV